MPKYTVAFSTTAYAYLNVEAGTPEEAREIADQEFVRADICAQCSGWGRSESEPRLELNDVWTMDESDDGVVEAD